jgi:hypothetical protein
MVTTGGAAVCGAIDRRVIYDMFIESVSLFIVSVLYCSQMELRLDFWEDELTNPIAPVT